MRVLDICTEEHFKSLFDKRDFNPPPQGDEHFDEEFSSTLALVEAFLERKVGSGSYSLHQYHNRSRFIDVCFTSEDYLRPELILGLQEQLKKLRNDWMVCLWEACFIFVAKTNIVGYDPTFNDPKFAKLR